MITVEDVHFAYPATPRPVSALAGVSLEVSPGETVAVVGANGSGKSTLALLCNGLLVPTQGRVRVDGLDTSDPHKTWDIRARVGLVLQDPDDQIVGTSVESDVAFGPENLGAPPDEIRDRIAWALGVVGLEGLERREPHLLSEGQKQRLAIAGALAMRPEYLVMDEPTSMLDPTGRVEVMKVLSRLAKSEGTGILHVTHRLEDVVRADRVLALSQGAIEYEGEPVGLLQDLPLMRKCAIALPAIWELAEGLRAHGIDVPIDALDAESIAEALPC